MSVTHAPIAAAMSSQAMHDIVDRAWKAGAGVEHLLKRKRALVARVKLDDGGSVIAKLWCSAGVRALLRRRMQATNCHAEWKALTLLHKAGASVPRPVGHCLMRKGPYTEALLVEDLGVCVMGLTYVKTLLREGREAEHEQFIDRIFEMTEVMLSHGVLDPDHGLHNILVKADGQPVRIDFEVARIAKGPRGQGPIYGDMIGRLLTSYIFAAQPDLARIGAFVRRIEKSLNPPSPVLRRAARYVQEQMKKQRTTMNVDTHVKLGW
jgi:serine/threonine-protein kinase RIO1